MPKLKFKVALILVLIPTFIFTLLVNGTTNSSVLAAAALFNGTDNRSCVSLTIKGNPTITDDFDITIKGARGNIDLLQTADAPNPRIFAKVGDRNSGEQSVAVGNVVGFANGDGTATVNLMNLPASQIKKLADGSVKTITLEFKFEQVVNGGDAKVVCGEDGVAVGRDTSKVEDGVNAAACCSTDDQCVTNYGLHSYCGTDSGKNASCQSGLKCINPAYPSDPNQARKDPGGSCNSDTDVCNNNSLCLPSNKAPFFSTCSYACRVDQPGDIAGCIASRYATVEATCPTGCNCTDPKLLTSTLETAFDGNTNNFSSSCPSSCITVNSYHDFNTQHTYQGWQCWAPTTEDQCSGSGDTKFKCFISATRDDANKQVNVTVFSTCLPNDQKYKIEVSGMSGAAKLSSTTVDPSQVQASYTVDNVAFSNTVPAITVSNTAGGVGGCSTSYPEWATNFNNPTPITSPVTPAPTPDLGSDDFGKGNCPYVDPKSAHIDLSTGAVVCDKAGVTSCGFTPLPLCANDSLADGTTCATQTQRNEFRSCSICERDGNTWVGGIGCVNTTPEGIFVSLIRIALGVMGGVGLFRIIYLGYVYQSGDDGKIKEARNGALGVLAGLLLALFSVLILRILGVNVLDVVPAGFFGSG